MPRALILVEGQTEERFVKEVLQPHLWTVGVHVAPKILTTKRMKRGGQFKGGVTSFGKVSRRIEGLFPEYRKRLHGPLVAGRIGLPVLRRECPHFHRWVCHLEEAPATERQ